MLTIWGKKRIDSIAEALPGYADLEFTFIYRLLTPVFIPVFFLILKMEEVFMKDSSILQGLLVSDKRISSLPSRRNILGILVTYWGQHVIYNICIPNITNIKALIKQSRRLKNFFLFKSENMDTWEFWRSLKIFLIILSSEKPHTNQKSTFRLNSLKQ